MHLAPKKQEALRDSLIQNRLLRFFTQRWDALRDVESNACSSGAQSMNERMK